MFGWYLICRNMSTDYVCFWKSIHAFKEYTSFVWIYSQLFSFRSFAVSYAYFISLVPPDKRCYVRRNEHYKVGTRDYWSHVVNLSLKYGRVVSWFTFFSCVWHFLSTSTRPSTLTLISICSLISLLWNKESPRSLGCIIRKLRHKVYRYVPVKPAVEEPVVGSP